MESETSQKLSLTEFLKEIEDPRIVGRCIHKLTDILLIGLIGVTGGAETFEEIAEYAEDKEEWLRTFLELPGGIPSHDTFNRVFSRIDPDELSSALTKWLIGIAKDKKVGEVVAIDGKTLRRTFDRATEQGPLHLVSAFATETGLVLGQKRTAEKSNEITAIPELIRELDLAGCIVTIDAMGCQKEIAREIFEAEAKYILALKDNHPLMHKEITGYFDFEIEGEWPNDSVHSFYKEISKGHGRLEVRRIWASSDIEWFSEKKKWAGLKSIVRVECETILSNGKKYTGIRHFISSLPPEAPLLAKSIRDHWKIENQLHWVLDVVFHEDYSRVRRDHGPENLALLNRTALSLLKKAPGKGSIKGKRKKAGRNNAYLLEVLKHSFE